MVGGEKGKRPNTGPRSYDMTTVSLFFFLQRRIFA